ncbi:MAG: SDR family oxidoreductase [Spirochaetales bacterium]|nr:SDR family oxidoreductase [Spirochaetales bacterium]
MIKGKWALVTGASRGIGLRVARALAEKGAQVILQSRKLSGTEKLKQEIIGMGGVAHSIAAELSDLNAVYTLIKKVKNITGDHLDILYNNAAIMTTYREQFYDTPADDYTMSFLVNSTVPALLCNAFIPAMIKHGWGRVVNVTSGIADQPSLLAYSASKAALDRYVRDMVPTLEGTGVLMNLMDPGWLRTDLGGPNAPNDPDTVLPGALVPVLLEDSQASGKLYCAQDYGE